MIYHRKPDWLIRENLITDEHLFLNRRNLMAGIGAGAGHSDDHACWRKRNPFFRCHQRRAGRRRLCCAQRHSGVDHGASGAETPDR